MAYKLYFLLIIQHDFVILFYVEYINSIYDTCWILLRYISEIRFVDSTTFIGELGTYEK